MSFTRSNLQSYTDVLPVAKGLITFVLFTIQHHNARIWSAVHMLLYPFRYGKLLWQLLYSHVFNVLLVQVLRKYSLQNGRVFPQWQLQIYNHIYTHIHLYTHTQSHIDVSPVKNDKFSIESFVTFYLSVIYRHNAYFLSFTYTHIHTHTHI